MKSREDIPHTSEQVETDIADLPFRIPIVKGISEPGAAEGAQDLKDPADRQWAALTAVARRAILSSRDARHTAAVFTKLPVSEALPEVAIDAIAKRDRRTRIARLMSDSLRTVLAHDQIPDTALHPDIRHAPALQRDTDAIAFLTHRHAGGPELYKKSLAYKRQDVIQNPGVTEAEKNLVSRRYRYARDVKLLGLMAELHDQPFKREGAGEIVTHELKSGTKLAMTEDAFKENPTLLDPRAWQERRQIKDRVYAVIVDGKEYIMKERKTPRHMHTKDHGHVDGLTSQQEFEAAREFAKLGTIRRGDILAHWEKPLGYVEFPDGYQFCLFESEPNMMKDAPRQALAQEIEVSSEAYADEFAEAKQRAKEIYAERKDLLFGYEDPEPTPRPKWYDFSREARRLRREIKEEPRPDELTFEEFAELKAHHLIGEAQELLNQTMWNKGYVNTDFDGQSFRLVKGERPTLEIIGFDFEYYYRNLDDARSVQRNVQENNQSGRGARLRSYKAAHSRPIMIAASYSMLEQMGWKLPPKSEF